MTNPTPDLDRAIREAVEADIDMMAIAFIDGFTHGNADWRCMPDHHRESYREGIRSLIAAIRKDQP